jgi:hypothetical protein
MAQEQKPCKGVVHTQLFWDSLAEFRGSGQYESIRGKIREFLQFKLNNYGLHPNESPYQRGELKGYLHVKLRRNPDVVLMHDVVDGQVVLLKVGNHNDYSYHGKNMGADCRNARLFESMNKVNVPSPDRDYMPRWKTPEDLILHPDLADLSLRSLHELMAQIEAETRNSIRYQKATGIALEFAPEKEALAYLDRCLKAHEVLQEISNFKLDKRQTQNYDTATNWKRFG